MTKINDVFSAEVRDISSEGNGIVGHPSGKTFFVPGVWLGEAGEFRITGFKSRYGFAELVKLNTVSPSRIEAPCAHHGFSSGQCGGCPWQFVEYSAQLEVKQQRVVNSLVRLEESIAETTAEIIKPIWGSPDIFGYRNRTQFKTDGRQLGYVSASSRELAPIKDCLILNDKNRETLQQLLQSLPRNDFKPAGKKRRNKSQWNTLDIDDQISAEEVVLNQRRPFRQGNSAQNKKMRQWLSEKLSALKTTEEKKSTQVLELFSGAGNFTEVISVAGFEKILAVEGVEETLLELKKKQLPGVDTFVANLFLPESLEGILWRKPDIEVLVLDPPRDGLKGRAGLFSNSSNKASTAAVKSASKLTDIFYISCNLATFVRDITDFYEQGFRLKEVQPLDQFPHTPHIELMAHLSKS